MKIINPPIDNITYEGNGNPQSGLSNQKKLWKSSYNQIEAPGDEKQIQNLDQ